MSRGKGAFVGCHVSMELYNKVNAEAEKLGITASELIREALTKYLELKDAEARIKELSKERDELKSKVEELAKSLDLKAKELNELKELLSTAQKPLSGGLKLPVTIMMKYRDRLNELRSKVERFRCFIQGVEGAEDFTVQLSRVLSEALNLLLEIQKEASQP
ncbi:MAG: ribbon-helix-helix protein, CopG family [Candidatus Nezhaarchaeales archaeon]